MTTEKKVARRKLSLLELASDLKNVSRACKIMGYTRQQFYEIRRNYQTFGADGLIDRLPGPKGPHCARPSATCNEPSTVWHGKSWPSATTTVRPEPPCATWA